MKKALSFILFAVAVMVFNANAQVTLLNEGFETGTIPVGWTVIDADGDGSAWEIYFQGHLDNYQGHSLASYSQSNVTPDNWLVTPAITLGSSSSLSFWRMTGFMHPADHYGVYVSTTSPTDTSSFTLLFEETPTAESNWVGQTVNLSAYDNSTVYIAFRHFNCTNQFAILLDDILVTAQTVSPVISVSPTSLQFVDVPLNTPSAGQLVTVNTFNITGAVTATVTAPFEISTDDSNYSYTATLADTVHNLYVRYVPTVVGADSAVVHLTSGTAITDVFLYGTSITCAAPTELAASTVTSTSAVLKWTGSANSYNIYYKSASESVWMEVANVSDTTYTLSNLLPSTTYAWIVTSVCDDGTLVYSEGTNMFTTGCAAYTAPFVQNFDGSTSIPQCWERYSGWVNDVLAGGTLTPATGGWVFSNLHVFGAHHARLNIYGNNTNRWLVTPPIDLTGLANPALTFDLALTSWNNANPIADTNGQPDDKFMVIISTDGGATWDSTNVTVWSNDGNGDYVFNQIPAAGQEVTISLADYVGQTVRIAFYGESSVVNGDNDLHIDNVMVNFATSCAKPTNLTVATVTSGSVTLAWTENGTATAWNIEYGPTGYQQGSSVATLVQVDTNPFTIGNLGVAVYDFYVRADCGDEQSYWVGPITAAPGSYNMNISGSETLTTCALIVYDNGGASGNYAADCNSTLVLLPEVSGNALTVSGTYHTETCCDYLRIYDGLDTNGTMLGQFKGTGVLPLLASSSGPLTIYFHSDGGMQYSGFELIVNCVSCIPPGNLTASNITPDSAHLAWTGASNSYIMEYKAAEDTAWTSLTVADTSITLTGLQSATAYTVNIYSDCDSLFSPASTITFTTTMAPAGIPFSTDFSSTAGWVLNNGNCNNYWIIAPVSDTANALFITNNGTTPGYNTSSFSGVSAEKLFTVGTASELEISFDVQIGGEGEFDYLKVYFAPEDEVYPAVTTNVAYTDAPYLAYAVNFSNYLQYSGCSSMPYKYNLTNGNTVSVSVVMPNPNANPDANSTAKLVFLWKNDTSDGSQPGAIVRNVSIESLDCQAPISLTVSNVTTTSADVAWTPSGDEDDWILEYRENGASTWTSIPVTGTPVYTLTGLNLGTTYQVRVQTVCGEGNQSVWISTSFTTFCDAITTFPFVEDFEHGTQMPDCWTQEYVNGVLNWTAHVGGESHGSIQQAHGGSYNAFFFAQNNNGSTTRLITPVLNLSNMTDAYVSYWHAQQPWSTDQDQLSVYYRTSPSDQWHVLIQYPTAVNVWTKDSLALPDLTATYQLAFEGVANFGYGIVLDDITVDGTLIPILTDPTVVTNAATNVGQTVATLNATITNPDSVTITAKGFEWKATTDDAYTQVASSGAGDTFSYSLTGLTDNTTYTFKAFITFDSGTVYGDEMTFTTEIDSTGVESFLDASVTLYPNPAKEVVTVACRMHNAEYEIETVEVYDVYGKLVNTVEVNENPIRINVSNLADGMYFVRVTTDAGAVTKRFVKK